MSSDLYIGPMTEPEPSLAEQRRNLLPRTPSDRVVTLLLAIGVGVALLAHADLAFGAVPGAVAAIAQKVNGHVQAWRRGGIERAFVMETTAISFYVLVAALVVGGAVQAAGTVDHVDAGWFALGALFIDTVVRSARESRFA